MTFTPADTADYNMVTSATNINVAPNPTPLVTIRGIHEQKLKLSRKKSAEVVVVSFSGALDAAEAQDLAAYNLAVAPKNSKPGARHGMKVILSSAKYNPTTMAVTLTPKRPLPTKLLQLSINTALTLDAQGRPVDGNRDGQPGGTFLTTFGKAGVSLSRISEANAFPRVSAKAFDTPLAGGDLFSRRGWGSPLRQK